MAVGQALVVDPALAVGQGLVFDLALVADPASVVDLAMAVGQKLMAAYEDHPSSLQQDIVLDHLHSRAAFDLYR